MEDTRLELVSNWSWTVNVGVSWRTSAKPKIRCAQNREKELVTSGVRGTELITTQHSDEEYTSKVEAFFSCEWLTQVERWISNGTLIRAPVPSHSANTTHCCPIDNQSFHGRTEQEVRARFGTWAVIRDAATTFLVERPTKLSYLPGIAKTCPSCWGSSGNERAIAY